MHLIETTPAPCTVCGRGNTPDSSGDRPRFIDLERDVNWNDPVIICEDCVAKMGGMVGMMSKDTMSEFKLAIREREHALHDLQAEMDMMKRRAKKLGIEFTPVGV